MFYPRDFSLVCPTELSAFSARHAEFAGLGAELLALSTDSIDQVIHNLNVGRRTDEVLRVLTALQTGGLCAESWVPGHKTIDSDRLAPGHIVSHYRIEGTLGEGGFGTVYVAHDTVLDRKVALKIGKDQIGLTSSVQHEAQAAAALNHPRPIPRWTDAVWCLTSSPATTKKTSSATLVARPRSIRMRAVQRRSVL